MREKTVKNKKIALIIDILMYLLMLALSSMGDTIICLVHRLIITVEER